MPFDWTNYLRLAENLAREPDDASLRTAISRAYYFAFNIAFTRAKSTTGESPHEESVHKWCWDKYRKSPDPTSMKLGVSGDRMKLRRVRADYNSADIHRIGDEAQRTVEDAREFQADFARLDPRHPTR